VDASVETVKRRLLRLALDVHDGPMQNLAAVGFTLGDLRRRIRALVPPEHQQKIDSGLDQLSAELGRVESELRSLIGALEDGSIESIPLLEAIELEIREFERRSPAVVELVSSGHPRAETDSQRIALQSVTRAALANVAKHAEAKHVWVRVSGTADRVAVEIEDDGGGFDASSANPGHFGLVGMRERVELLGGDFAVESRPGGPTRIAATLQKWRPPSQD
jgi:two-component system, NarL family, sensor histidine kinase UhpB